MASTKQTKSHDKPDASAPSPQIPEKVLVIDIGGTKLKVLATGQSEPRKITSGKLLTPARMVKRVKALTDDWDYDAISLGLPGLVGNLGALSEPMNLAPGWVGFDFAAAFDRPVKIINDAAMQALGSYDGGRMLFLGLGTGLGSALIVQNTIISLELGRLLHTDGRELGDVLGRRGLKTIGKKVWRAIIKRIVPVLISAFGVDYVVLGGGNSKEIKVLPPGARLGHNLTAFRGGFRLWHLDEMPQQDSSGSLPPVITDWKLF